MWESLSFAIGIALSPFPVIPVILLLFTPRARVASSAFAAGWVSGIALGVAVAVVLGDLLDSSSATPTWVSWVKTIGGVGLIALGTKKWLKRGAETEMPGWMTAVQTASPFGALRIGFLLAAVNPKILAFAIGAGLVIGAESTSLASEVATTATFVLVAAAPVLLPVGVFLIAGERVLPPIDRVRIWLEANNAAVMGIVLFVIGLILLRSGLVEII